MRNEKYKQMACIAETQPAIFEAKMNAILAGMVNPEIVLDKTQPYTAYVFYSVKKDIPESRLELLEMVEGSSTCKGCPFLQKSTDRRRKWHTCTFWDEPTREDSRACEVYYMKQGKQYGDALEKYNTIPYTLEGRK